MSRPGAVIISVCWWLATAGLGAVLVPWRLTGWHANHTTTWWPALAVSGTHARRRRRAHDRGSLRSLRRRGRHTDAGCGHSALGRDRPEPARPESHLPRSNSYLHRRDPDLAPLEHARFHPHRMGGRRRIRPLLRRAQTQAPLRSNLRGLPSGNPSVDTALHKAHMTRFANERIRRGTVARTVFSA